MDNLVSKLTKVDISSNPADPDPKDDADSTSRIVIAKENTKTVSGSSKPTFLNLPGEIRTLIYLEYLKDAEEFIDDLWLPTTKEEILESLNAYYYSETPELLPSDDWKLDDKGQYWKRNLLHRALGQSYIEPSHWNSLRAIFSVSRQIREEMVSLLLSNEIGYFDRTWRTGWPLSSSFQSSEGRSSGASE